MAGVAVHGPVRDGRPSRRRHLATWPSSWLPTSRSDWSRWPATPMRSRPTGSWSSRTTTSATTARRSIPNCARSPRPHRERTSPPTACGVAGRWSSRITPTRCRSPVSPSGSTSATSLPGRERDVLYMGVWPNLLISPHPDYVMTHRMVPTRSGPDLHRMRLAVPAGSPRARGLRSHLCSGVLGHHQLGGLDGLHQRAEGSRQPGFPPGPALSVGDRPSISSFTWWVRPIPVRESRRRRCRFGPTWSKPSSDGL